MNTSSLQIMASIDTTSVKAATDLQSNGVPVTLRGIVYLRQRRRISCAAKTMFTVSFRQFPTMNWTLSVIGREPAEVLRIFPVK